MREKESKISMVRRGSQILAKFLEANNGTIDDMVFDQFIVENLGKHARSSSISNELIEFLNISDNSKVVQNPEILKRATTLAVKIYNTLYSSSYFTTLGQLVSHFSQALSFGTFENDLTDNWQYFIKRKCSSISKEENLLHDFLSKLSGIGNQTFKVSLFDLPYLIAIPDARTAVSSPKRESAYFSHCSLIKSGLAGADFYLTFGGRSSCFRKWDSYIINPNQSHPCDSSDDKIKNLCCIWSDIFGNDLETIMTVMKHSNHRGMTLESVSVRYASILNCKQR